VAGINAAHSLTGKEFVLTRTDAYIGVMIDDLTTNGAAEPYRMFTSRAEHRLILRADNADMRLTERGHAVGSVSSERLKRFMRTKQGLEETISQLKNKIYLPTTLAKHGISISQDGNKRNAFDLMSYPSISLEELREVCTELTELRPKILERVKIESKYSKYLERQEEDIRLFRKHENLIIPHDFSAHDIPGLSEEVRERIMTLKPKTVGSLSKISGVTPAAILVILIYLTKKKKCET
jgi:tRNA uridine 5-carboxymethylaminomethyl modification enzyme